MASDYLLGSHAVTKRFEECLVRAPGKSLHRRFQGALREILQCSSPFVSRCAVRVANYAAILTSCIAPGHCTGTRWKKHPARKAGMTRCWGGHAWCETQRRPEAEGGRPKAALARACSTSLGPSLAPSTMKQPNGSHATSLVRGYRFFRNVKAAVYRLTGKPDPRLPA